MRTVIKKKEWDRFFYKSRQKWGQRKIRKESIEKETKKVEYVLQQMNNLKFLPDTTYDREKFLDFRELVHKEFYIIWTAINAPVEHLLYAISEILQPKRVLGLGIFTGNPVVWSLGPAIDKLYTVEKMAAVEIDKKHAASCDSNFKKISPDIPVEVYAADAFTLLDEFEDGELDMIYMDANGYDPTTGKNSKNINYSLLKAYYPKLKPGGFAIVHNAYQPSFTRDAKMYCDFTNDTNYFSQTATLAIDEMGLEFSIKK